MYAKIHTKNKKKAPEFRLTAKAMGWDIEFETVAGWTIGYGLLQELFWFYVHNHILGFQHCLKGGVYEVKSLLAYICFCYANLYFPLHTHTHRYNKL